MLGLYIPPIIREIRGVPPRSLLKGFGFLETVRAAFWFLRAEEEKGGPLSRTYGFSKEPLAQLHYKPAGGLFLLLEWKG